MKKKKRKLNIKRVLTLLLLICIICLIPTLINKNSKSNINTNDVTPNSGEITETAENVTEQKAETSIVDNLTEEEIKLSQERGLPVLMYHFFYDETAGETGADNNFMEIHDFEEQIKYLSDNNYYVPTWEEICDYVAGTKGLPEKSVIITVDDGNESFFRLAVPVPEKYNFTATSFVITSWYGDTLSSYASPVVDFQSHSNNMHRAGSDGNGAFLTLSYDEACADLEQSRSVIGENCRVFCYPFGHFNDTTKEILKDCDFILAFTTKAGRVFPGMDPYELPRVRMSKGVSLNSFISMVK